MIFRSLLNSKSYVHLYKSYISRSLYKYPPNTAEIGANVITDTCPFIGDKIIIDRVRIIGLCPLCKKIIAPPDNEIPFIKGPPLSQQCPYYKK